jgi:hypothetical protein
MSNLPASTATETPNSTPNSTPTPTLQPNPYVYATGPFPPWATPYRAGPIPNHAVIARPLPKPKPFSARELVALVLVIASADVALWNHDFFGSGGFGLAIFFAALPALTWFAARKARMTLRFGAIAALLAAVAIRCAYHPTAGVVLSGLGLLGAFVIALRLRKTYVPELFASVFASLEKFPSRVTALFQGIGKTWAKTRVGKVSLLPIVVPLGLALAFLGVFALANPVVEHGVVVAWEAVARTIGFPSPVRIVMWAFLFFCAAALLRPACVRTRTADAAIVEGVATKTSALVARNALVLLNAMFLLYNALDATCLWAGAPPKGVTTQAYAHQGAFWLTVALAMLTAVVGYFFRSALAHDPNAKLQRILGYAWMAQGLVLALGTYRRIAIHVAYSGLSDLRIVGILGTTLVVGGMALVAFKLHRMRSFGWLVRKQLDAFALALVLYAVMPTHYIASRVNVTRIERGEYRPLVHMFRQSDSTESAAQLLPLLDHGDLRVRQGVAALLADKRETLRKEVDEETSFRQKDIAERRTLAALDLAYPHIVETLGKADRGEARGVLLELARVSNDGGSWEELWAIQAAGSHDPSELNYERRSQ